KLDLENFLKSRQYYHRLGRVWKRSYLLYGPAGTGKSTFIAAMAKFLSYDVYEINLHKVRNDADLKYLLLQTTKKSLLVIKDHDRHLEDKSPALSLSGVLNFMDGIFSCCGEERVMVFTINSKENICASILRPGRIGVHINFPLCDFTAFKNRSRRNLAVFAKKPCTFGWGGAHHKQRISLTAFKRGGILHPCFGNSGRSMRLDRI
ncbi:AAA-ATPase At2g46620-like, partial [Salvia miltiorrhiza]|uniref:AAA-ATPase At2g46620-like n=1 Tax=Salvia miltiorrhiza TaxID=226208 RepID=UPI0025AC0AA8